MGQSDFFVDNWSKGLSKHCPVIFLRILTLTPLNLLCAYMACVDKVVCSEIVFSIDIYMENMENDSLWRWSELSHSFMDNFVGMRSEWPSSSLTCVYVYMGRQNQCMLARRHARRQQCHVVGAPDVRCEWRTQIWHMFSVSINDNNYKLPKY